jgi:hypothetical protein
MYDSGGWTDTLIGYAIRTLILVLFLLTLRGLLIQISPRNRAFKPNLVWLNLIPVLDYAWIFVTLVKVRDSVRAEYRERDWAHRRDTSFGMGLTSAICYVGLEVLGSVWVFVPGFGGGSALIGVLGLVALVFWVTYWVKISRIKQTLEREAFIPAQERQTRCSSCGLLSMPGDEFCRSCGLRVGPPERGSAEAAEPAEDSGDEAVGTCSSCGADYRPNARFCSSCGRPVA